jgi:hypothetical protein
MAVEKKAAYSLLALIKPDDRAGPIAVDQKQRTSADTN